ncbi:MAG: hypothetical protein CMP75_01375, partial [Flavobacteriales bacterium]|nr:hypothetical protein [Flavobacteriales bacterium]
MRNFILLIAVFTFFNVKAQYIYQSDTTLCLGESITIGASGAVVEPSLINTDDIHSGVIDLPFDFEFYGDIYNQFVISANGYITFNLGVANQYAVYPILAPIPNPGNEPENAIMAPWHDIDPGVAGNIVYGTLGIAPNRIFYIIFCEIPMYACNDLIANQQIMLFESSNKIEMHIKDKPLCTNWNGGNAIQGLVSVNSTFSHIVDDPVLLQPRNFPIQWEAYDEGWEFTPNGADDYVINQIDFNPLNAGGVLWYDQFDNFITNLTEIEATAVYDTTIFYTWSVDLCSGDIIPNVDSLVIFGEAPQNSGNDTLVYECDNLEEIILYNYLSDDVSQLGTWYDGSGQIISPLLDVDVQNSDTYVYELEGISDNCTDSAFVNLFIDSLPYAGNDGYRLICYEDNPFELITYLEQNPENGGYWIGPFGSIVSDIFYPSVNDIGDYTYVIEGQNACPDDTSFLSIFFNEASDYFVLSDEVSCPDALDGEISFFITNGVSPYQY